MFYPKNIPLEMRKNKNWVLFKKIDNPKNSNHPLKMMISLEGRWHKAKSTDNKDWSTFTKTLQTLNRTNFDGMAYVLDQDIVFIDVDNSIDEDGNLSSLACELLETFPNTYAEKSCSGRGIHIFLKGKLDINSMKRNDSIGLEIYDSKRFCCMTGDIISQTKEICDYQDKLNKITNKYLGKRETISLDNIRQPISLNNNEILKKALNSKVGYKISKLYQGDYSDYPSRSNADMALMNYLAFYTKDPNQLDLIMRSSGLYREKWDEKRGNTTYGRITINHAIAYCKNSYEGKHKSIEMY